MGLDTFASRLPDAIVLTPADEAAFAALDLPLCEWIVVDSVADVILTQDWIPPDRVAQMAAAFEACDPEAVAHASEDDHYPVTADEVRALRNLLRLCAHRGLGLVGWW
jgi:hypothetical protein